MFCFSKGLADEFLCCHCGVPSKSNKTPINKRIIADCLEPDLQLTDPVCGARSRLEHTEILQLQYFGIIIYGGYRCQTYALAAFETRTRGNTMREVVASWSCGLFPLHLFLQLVPEGGVCVIATITLGELHVVSDDLVKLGIFLARKEGE